MSLLDVRGSPIDFGFGSFDLVSVCGCTMEQMLCVRSDLKMGKGKIAAQCAHAAVGACERLMKNNPDLFKAYTYQVSTDL